MTETGSKDSDRDEEQRKPESDQNGDQSGAGSRERGKQGDENGPEKEDEAPPPATWLEKAATAFGAVLVAALIGVLLYDATRTHLPASFVVTTGAAQVVHDSYRLPVHVLNSGDEAAQAVMVHVELIGPDSVLSEIDLNIDWLAGHETHDAVGYFKRPSVPHRFRAEVRGFTEP